jgi:hypothetical protein
MTNDAGPNGIASSQSHAASTRRSFVTSQRDSGSGWASILIPGIAFRFNPLFSLNASVPVYAYINVEANTGTKAKPVYTATTKQEFWAMPHSLRRSTPTRRCASATGQYFLLKNDRLMEGKIGQQTAIFSLKIDFFAV